jgi:hypothetical protein
MSSRYFCFGTVSFDGVSVALFGRVTVAFSRATSEASGGFCFGTVSSAVAILEVVVGLAELSTPSNSFVWEDGDAEEHAFFFRDAGFILTVVTWEASLGLVLGSTMIWSCFQPRWLHTNIQYLP